jgi:hypothetical protein
MPAARSELSRPQSAASYAGRRLYTKSAKTLTRGRARQLEEAGYVAVEKKFVLRKPQTLYRITEPGRQALTEYVQALKQLLGPAIDA